MEKQILIQYQSKGRELAQAAHSSEWEKIDGIIETLVSLLEQYVKIKKLNLANELPVAYLDYAIIIIRNGRYKSEAKYAIPYLLKAEEYQASALKLSPTFPAELYSNMYTACDMCGDYEKAFYSIEKSIDFVLNFYAEDDVNRKSSILTIVNDPFLMKHEYDQYRSKIQEWKELAENISAHDDEDWS